MNQGDTYLWVIFRKFRRMTCPSGVSMDSGWNWTPNKGKRVCCTALTRVLKLLLPPLCSGCWRMKSSAKRQQFAGADSALYRFGICAVWLIDAQKNPWSMNIDQGRKILLSAVPPWFAAMKPRTWQGTSIPPAADVCLNVAAFTAPSADQNEQIGVTNMCQAL